MSVTYVCPNCGNDGMFATFVRIGVLIDSDGNMLDSATPNGQLEIGPDFPMGCMSCDYRGEAQTFVVDEDGE